MAYINKFLNYLQTPEAKKSCKTSVRYKFALEEEPWGTLNVLESNVGNRNTYSASIIYGCTF